MYTHPDYLDPTIPQIQVRALFCFSAEACGTMGAPEDAKFLRFEKGDVITNVVKEDGGWWRGDFGDVEQGCFPNEYVEEMEHGDSPFGQLQKGSVTLAGSTVDIDKGQDEKCPYPYVLRIKSPGSSAQFRAAVSTLKEAKEWKEAISHVANKADRRVSFEL